MKNLKVMLSLMIVAILAMGFVVGCGSSSDDGGGSSTGTITGTVQDANGNPLEGALCSVTDNAKATITDTTDEDGDFILSGVQEGTWTMSVSLTGYINLSVSVSVSGGSTTEVPTSSTTMTPETFGDVTGTVSDNATAATIQDATVAIGSTSAASAADGTYTLSNIATGAQTISATKTGYLAYSGSVTVVADSTVTHDIAMTSEEPTPEPGKGNVKGKVVDADGVALSGVEVTEQKGKATTGTDGMFLLQNLDPGEVILAYAKTGYTSATQTVSVVEATTVTAPEMTLTTEPAAGTTIWVSKRVNLPEENGANRPHASEDGSVVVFDSQGNVINNWNSPGANFQVYMWKRSTATITRLTNNNNVPNSTAGAGPVATNSYNARVSGDGTSVVFMSNSTDILADGLAAATPAANFQIYYVNASSIDSLVIGRISNNNANANNPCDDVCALPDVNYDGTAVVFASQATDVGDISAGGANYHIFRCTVAKGKAVTPGVRRMLTRTLAGAAGNAGVAVAHGTGSGIAVNANGPRISKGGVYTTFQTAATDVTAGAADNAGMIYRNCINDDPAIGWNMVVSAHNGTQATANTSASPAINGDGSKIVFQSTAANLSGGGAVSDVYMWTNGQTALTQVSVPLAGTKRASTNATISYDGTMVAFLSGTDGLISDVNPGAAAVFGFAKDVTTGQNVYTLATKGASNQVPNATVNYLNISGNGQYAVFETQATNLTSDTYTATRDDVFIHKFQ